MRAAGTSTIAQDQNTAVVWGMPGQAVQLEAVEIVLPLSLISAQSLNICSPLRKTGDSPLKKTSVFSDELSAQRRPR